MVLTGNQRKEMVIKHYEEGKTTREIAKELRISLREYPVSYWKEYKKKEPEPKPSKSPRAEAFQMFSDSGKLLLKY